MAKNFVKVDRTTTTAVYAQDLLTTITQVRNLLNQLQKVKDVMDSNWVATDFADLEALFGLPVGQGATVYPWVRDTLAALQGTAQSSAALTLIARVG